MKSLAGFLSAVCIISFCAMGCDSGDNGTTVDTPVDTTIEDMAVDTPADIPREDVTPDPTPDLTPDPTPDLTPDTTPDLTPDLPTDTPTEPGACTNDFGAATPAEQFAVYGEGELTGWNYGGSLAGSFTTPPVTYLGIELWTTFGGPSTPGSYTFTDANYATCPICGVFWKDCTADGCATQFLVTSGDLTISELGVVDGTMSGTVANLEAIEVTIDPDTYTSTPVSGGQTACMDSMSFTATVEAP